MAIEEKAKVVFCGRRKDKGQAVQQAIQDASGQALFVQADVLKVADIERVFQVAKDTYGGVDIAIPNAGIEGNPTSNIMSEGFMDNYRRVVDVNLDSIVNTSRVAVSYLEKNPHTGFLFVYSSVAAPGMAAYCMAKAACDALVRCLAAETPDAVQVYSFNPYTIDSELSRRVLGLFGVSLDDWARDHNPSGKVGTGQDIGKLIADTCKGKYQNEYPSGSNLLTDGRVLFHAREAGVLAGMWGTSEFKQLVEKHGI